MNRATKEGFVDVGWKARGDRLDIDSDPLKFRGICNPNSNWVLSPIYGKNKHA